MFALSNMLFFSSTVVSIPFIFLFDMWRKKVCLCAPLSDSDTAKKSMSVATVGVYNTNFEGFRGHSAHLCACPLLSRMQAEQRGVRQDSVPGWLVHKLFSDLFSCCNRSLELPATLCLYTCPRPNSTCSLFHVVFVFFSVLAIDARHANRMCLVEVFMLYNLSKWV